MPDRKKEAGQTEGGTLLERLAEHPAARRWIVLGGLAGIALIALSGLLPAGGGQEQSAPAGEDLPVSAQAYADGLEERLARLISSMEGAGEAQVLVTLDRSTEQVYATEERSAQTTDGEGADGESQTTYFSVRASDGAEQALPLTELQPVIRGVVVVCPGGGSAAVAERITQAVTTALDISSARVCVVESKSQKETGG